MRPVDADKQLEWVGCMTPIHGIGLEPVVAVETVRDLIKGAPTIDAIPVEWIFEQMQILHELHNKNEYVLQWLIEMWQKEQEAQNG